MALKIYSQNIYYVNKVSFEIIKKKLKDKPACLIFGLGSEEQNEPAVWIWDGVNLKEVTDYTSIAKCLSKSIHRHIDSDFDETDFSDIKQRLIEIDKKDTI